MVVVARTDRQTDTTERPTNATDIGGVLHLRDYAYYKAIRLLSHWKSFRKQTFGKFHEIEHTLYCEIEFQSDLFISKVDCSH